MKYLSVCSGIEAATVAWHGLGWEPVAFAEIEAFPAAVLSHHYPTVPNLGDLTKYREWPEELLVEVELLVGGTPCQAFSVAGQRRSLDDERGNLSLVYVNLYHHINEVRKRHGRPPAIALWENVPGVLSTKDNAFGCFIGGLLGCDEAPETESGKWDKAGFLSSETVRVGYRVLDAQYFGVAQRRRRVFLAAVPCELVERFGERACPSEILSLRESVLGNPPTRGTAWEGASRDTTACAASRSGCGEPFYLDRASFNQGENAQYEPQITNDGVAAAAVARGPGAVMWSASDQANAERLVDQAGTLNCNLGQRGGWIAGCPDPAYALSAGNQSKGGVFGSGRDSQDTFVACFHPTQDPISSTDGSAHAMGTGSKGGCLSHAVCVTGQCTHALTTRAAACEEDGTGMGTPITPAVAFKPGQSEAAGGTFVTEEFTPTMQAQNNGSTAVPAVAFTKAKRAQSSTDDESWVPGSVAPTQNQFDQGDTRATTVVALRSGCHTQKDHALYTKGYPARQQNACSQEADSRKVLPLLREEVGEKDFAEWGLGILDSLQGEEVLRSGVLGEGDGAAEEVSDSEAGREVVGGSSQSKKHMPQGRVSKVRKAGRERRASQGWKLSEQLAGELGAYLQELSQQNSPAEEIVRDLRKASEGIRLLHDALPEVQDVGRSAGDEVEPVRSASEMQRGHQAQPMCVRRLTATECEFLQGFPENYTLVTYRKKPAADGPRYRALGNSMAVPCMWWLGHRIHQATR